MNLEYIYNQIACLSPGIEILLRRLYWNHIDIFSRYKPKYHTIKSKTGEAVDFIQILDALKRMGVKQGDLLVIHSSYDALACTGLSPDRIIDVLLELIGKDGTLAMPVIRKYKEQPRKGKEYLLYNMDNIECTYNVQKSLIVTGFLPYYLMSRNDSVTSMHPLNPMTAIGPLANDMMKKNLEGDKPSPHGPNSSWKYCLDHNAVVVGLGIDLAHYLTITHVAEEAFPDWPVNEREWYRERKFRVINRNIEQTITVKERKPKWGTMHYAEKNLKKMILKKNILHIENISGIEVSLLDSQEYIGFLRSINKKGFPYVIPEKYLTC